MNHEYIYTENSNTICLWCANGRSTNPVALRMAKTSLGFGHSECNRVTKYQHTLLDNKVYLKRFVLRRMDTADIFTVIFVKGRQPLWLSLRLAMHKIPWGKRKQKQNRKKKQQNRKKKKKKKKKKTTTENYFRGSNLLPMEQILPFYTSTQLIKEIKCFCLPFKCIHFL